MTRPLLLSLLPACVSHEGETEYVTDGPCPVVSALIPGEVRSAYGSETGLTSDGEDGYYYPEVEVSGSLVAVACNADASDIPDSGGHLWLTVWYIPGENNGEAVFFPSREEETGETGEEGS